MTSKTDELALETAIEKTLCGISTEDIKNDAVAESNSAYGGNGFLIGNPQDYNAKFAIDEVRFWDF